MAMPRAILFSTLKLIIPCTIKTMSGVLRRFKQTVFPSFCWEEHGFSLTVENKGMNNRYQNDMRSVPCENLNDLFLCISLVFCYFSGRRLCAFYSLMTCVSNFKGAVLFHLTRDWWVRYYHIIPSEKIETWGFGMDKRF